MNIHVNAKTTVKMRQVILRRVAQGWTSSTAASNAQCRSRNRGVEDCDRSLLGAQRTE